jgi:hypothetical protein
MFGDERVIAVARGLDAALTRAYHNRMTPTTVPVALANHST